MSVLVEKVKSIQIHCQDAGRLDGGRATAVDVKEGRAEHGEGTDQTWRGGEGGRDTEFWNEWTQLDKRHILGFSLVTFIEETTRQKKT